MQLQGNFFLSDLIKIGLGPDRSSSCVSILSARLSLPPWLVSNIFLVSPFQPGSPWELSEWRRQYQLISEHWLHFSSRSMLAIKIGSIFVCVFLQTIINITINLALHIIGASGFKVFLRYPTVYKHMSSLPNPLQIYHH